MSIFGEAQMGSAQKGSQLFPKWSCPSSIWVLALGFSSFLRQWSIAEEFTPDADVGVWMPAEAFCICAVNGSLFQSLSPLEAFVSRTRAIRVATIVSRSGPVTTILGYPGPVTTILGYHNSCGR